MSAWLDERQRVEALGVGLTALGILVLLAVGGPALGIPGGGRNLIGPAGAALERWLVGVFGWIAFAAALPALVWGLRFLGVVGTGRAARWSALLGGLLLLVPIGWWLLGDDAARGAAGWLGVTAGGWLSAAFGSVGAGLIVASALLALAVLTIGFSPVRSAGGAVRLGSRGAASLRAASGAVSRGLSSRIGRWRERTGEQTASPWESLEEEARNGIGATEEAPVEDGESVPPPGPAEDSEPRPALSADPGDLDLTTLPPLDLLTSSARSGSGLSERALRDLGGVLVDKLATFRVDGRIGGWTTGPVVTQFEVIPAAGVKVGQIAALADDLALALKAPSVRIVAPIPGKGAVGVEVPNPEPEIVHLRDILETPTYGGSRALLPLALGRDLSGSPYCADLARMPHLLIAGQTGSGKSVCINTIITSLIYRYSPRDLRLLMVDPKMVELIVYNDLPHLRHPVVTDNHDAATLLKWTVYEMGRRYALLSANACRNIVELNGRIRRGEEIRTPKDWGRSDYDEGTLPYIVLLIDELADLIMTVQAEVETPLALLAQKARAVGVHLVVATQRPSVNVLTGLIKANFPSRIAFRVASKTDSRTILDQNGAESLLGNGDLLFLPPGESDPIRIQGAFIATDDTERLLAWYREQAAARDRAEAADAGETDILEVMREREAEEAGTGAEAIEGDWDPFFWKAAEIVITNESGSTSLLQRRLKIGYGRAARIIDQLQDAGVLGPPDGSRPREVLIGLDQLAAMRGKEPPGGDAGTDGDEADA
ncbi:MAG: DNA translocase FtsK [Gemmatimonadota bacterium]